jgi:hypothetical protein
MTNQGGVQQAVRDRHGQPGNRDWNGDWHELFDQDGIAEGTFNERMLLWINAELGTSYTHLSGAMQAYAESLGFYNWSSMNTITANFAAETSTLLAAMDVEPATGRQSLINTYIVGLKDAGIWAKFDLLYVLAAHDEQAARLNWVAPASFEAVNVGAGPTFVADRGITGDGSSTAWSTGYIPNTNGVQFSLNNASMWVWCNTNVSENAADFGVSVSQSSFIRARSAGDTISAVLNGSATSTVAIASSIGLTGISRVDDSTQHLWKNGVEQGTGSGGFADGLPTGEVRICGRGTDLFSTKQIAMAAAGAALSEGEAADFYSLTLAYLQGVGAA